MESFVGHLQQLLGHEDCQIVWFLGAGCSRSSGIPTASGLVREWLQTLKLRETGSSDGFESWAHNRFPKWPIDPGSLYGELIELLFRVPELRQREVERLTDDKYPAIGYALLATIMCDERFSRQTNVALTTNFDDLLHDALFLIAGRKPLVVAHYSLAQFVRRSANRPLIVKLHGDARLAPRNTLSETTKLNRSMSVSLAYLLRDSGLVMAGYSGNDNSIARLLRSMPSNAFPWGVYWIADRTPSGPVGTVLNERGDVFWVPSQDFDEFMQEIAEVLAVGIPDLHRWESPEDRYGRANVGTLSVELMMKRKAERALLPGTDEDDWNEASMNDASKNMGRPIHRSNIALSPVGSGSARSAKVAFASDPSAFPSRTASPVRSSGQVDDTLGLSRSSPVTFVVPTLTVPAADPSASRWAVVTEDILAVRAIDHALAQRWPQAEVRTRIVDASDRRPPEPGNLVSFCRDVRNPVTAAVLHHARTRELFDFDFRFEPIPLRNGDAPVEWGIRFPGRGLVASPSFEQERMLEATGSTEAVTTVDDDALIALFPNPFGKGMAFVLAGVRAIGTWGAAEYLARHSRELLSRAGGKSFACLLRVRATYHVYPNEVDGALELLLVAAKDERPVLEELEFCRAP